MQASQPTQTQPTQQSPATQLEGSFDKSIICRLVCITGQYQFFDLDKDKATRTLGERGKNQKIWVVGRNVECDIVLSSSTRLSNRHFKLTVNFNDSTLWIQDSSTNGTHVNGNRLVKGSNYLINQGDEIAVGVGVPKDVVKFIVSFSDSFNASNSNNNSILKDEGIYKDFIIKNETIGQGAFATVKKAIERSTGISYAVKIINRRKALSTSNDNLLGVERELKILRKLDHPNIVKLKTYYEDIENYYLVMELVPGGDLMDFVAANGAIGEEATQIITKQVLEGIAYVHKLGISHRDLKPDNILIMQDDPILVKITDFGLAKISDNSSVMKTFCGTLAYVAPEVISGKYDSQMTSKAERNHYSSLVDIWSLGCLVYVLLTSHLPFNGKTQNLMFQKIKSGEYHEEPLKTYNITPIGREFLSGCLQVNPKLRWTAEEALKHPWIKNIDVSSQEVGDPSQGSQRISLSQSQSQQMRKVENGVQAANASMSKLDEDLMMRPIDSEKNRKAKRKNSFKVPRRVVPLPQSQQPRHTTNNQHNQVDVHNNQIDLPSNNHIDLPNDHTNLPNNRIELPNSLPNPSFSHKHTLQLSPSSSPNKRPKVEENKSVVLQSMSYSNGQLLSSHSQNSLRENDEPSPNPDAPSDVFIALSPTTNSTAKNTIYLRQGLSSYSIGRNETCDTFINDDRISKVHCLIRKVRHPVTGTFESAALCHVDIWLLDFSTNSCLINGVTIGRGNKAQLFDGDILSFFYEEKSKEQMSFSVHFEDATGVFNGGNPPDGPRFVNVLSLTPNEIRLKPTPVTDYRSGGSKVSQSNQEIGLDSFGNGGVFNPQLRQQRKAYDSMNRKSFQRQTLKRANLQSGQKGPFQSFFG